MMDHLEYVGQIVGDYRLLRWLGGGGFGNVYLAEQLREGQQVAVKVLPIRLTKQDDLRTFINEARMMRLRHPHIVPLLDFGLSRNNTPFLVMEYAPKGTLRDRHPKGTQVPLLTAVEYATQVASALQYAHDSHLVHRDVKPENMLVRSDGVVLLSDFGIATADHSTYSLSANQGMVGTVSYMAPEQLAGKPRATSDQYALAVVIYEWVAGRTPFRGTVIEVALQHATQLPPSLIAEVPEIPQEMEAVLFKALAKDHKERFPSMQAFLATLQHASASAKTRPPAFTTPLATPAFREITLSSALSLPVGGTTPIGAPSMTQSLAKQPAISLPETAPARDMRSFIPDTISQKHSAIAPTHRPVPSSVRKRGLSKRWGVLLILLSVLLIAGGSYAYSTVSNMQRTATTVVHQDATAMVRATATAVAKAASDAYNAAVTRHGIMYGFDAAQTRNNRYEHILNSANVSHLQQKWAMLTSSPIESPSTVANGVVYVGSDNGKLNAFDATTGQQKWTAPTGGLKDSAPAVASGVVYVGSTDDKLYAFDAASGQLKWSALTRYSIFSSPTVADGVVYVGSEDGNIYAFNAITGQLKWFNFTGSAIQTSPAVASGVVYVGSDNGKLYAFNAINGQQKWVAPTGDNSLNSSSPAVANGVVYIGSQDGNLNAFNAITGQSKWIRHITTGKSFAHAVCNSHSPAIANGVVYVSSLCNSLNAFDATTGQQKWTTPTEGGGSDPTVANSVIYVSSEDSNLNAFDAATGQQKWTAPTGDSNSPPAIANGMVYAGSIDGKLYAFSLPKNSA